MKVTKSSYGSLKDHLFYLKKKISALVLSDEKATKLKFKKIFGYKLDFNNVQTLNEKLQYIKIFMQRPEYEVFADKIKVQDYIKERLGDKYLIPILATYNDYHDIEQDKLPATPFILKTNHDCTGGIVVRDLNSLDFEWIIKFCKTNLSRNHYYYSREPHYKNINRKILIEKLLLDKDGKIPNDYKVNCINGKAEFIYCAIDREGSNYRRIYDRDWQFMPFSWGDETKLSGPDIARPSNLDEMLMVAEVLSNGFPYLRIDFYSFDQQLYIGEITILHGAGFDVISPKSMDEYYGRLMDLKA